MEVFDIKNRIDFNLVKKIFGNKDKGIEFLRYISNTPPPSRNLTSQEIYNLYCSKMGLSISFTCHKKNF